MMRDGVRCNDDWLVSAHYRVSVQSQCQAEPDSGQTVVLAGPLQSLSNSPPVRLTPHTTPPHWGLQSTIMVTTLHRVTKLYFVAELASNQNSHDCISVCLASWLLVPSDIDYQ